MAKKIIRSGGTGNWGSASSGPRYGRDFISASSAGEVQVQSKQPGEPPATDQEATTLTEEPGAKTGSSGFYNYWSSDWEEWIIMNAGIQNGRNVSNVFWTGRTPPSSFSTFYVLVKGYWIDGFSTSSFNTTDFWEYAKDQGHYYEGDDGSWYVSSYSDIEDDVADFIEDPELCLGQAAEGVAFSTKTIYDDDYYTYNSSVTGSIYEGCQLVVVACVYRQDSSGCNAYHGYQYTYDGVCDFNEMYSAPSGLSHSNGYLSWTNGTSSYPTCLEFYMHGQTDSHLGQSQATRTHAYEVICQATEGKYATGWAELGSNARFKTKTIPLYYAPNNFGAPSDFYNAFKTAVFDAVDSINNVLEPLGFKISTPTQRSYSLSAVDYDASLSSLPNGITVVCGTNDELGGPSYNWGNWWHTTDSNGYITKSKALIYYDEDHPYVGETIDPIVIEEILESMGPGGDSASLYKTIFADFVAAEKPKALTETEDIGTVELCYTEAPFNSLHEAGVRLRPTWGAKKLSAGTTRTSLSFLEPGRTYNIRLWHYRYAYDYYSGATQINNISVPSLTTPDAPVVTERLSGGARVSWGTSSGASGYEFEAISNWDDVVQDSYTGSATSQRIYLPYGTTHTLRVRAYTTWGGSKLYTGWASNPFTTNPSVPTMTYSVDKQTLSVNWSMIEGDATTVWFTLYTSSGSTYKAWTFNNQTSGSFTLSNIPEGTYIMKAWSELIVNGTSLEPLDDKPEWTIRISLRPEKFYWSDYTSALYAGGAVQNMSYTVWNAFVDNIKAVIENAGFGSTTMPSSSTHYGSAASKSFSTALGSYARMSANSELSKRYFNICNYIIDYVASNTAGVSTGIGVKYAHDSDYPVSYSDFITLQNRLNAIP